MVEWSSIFSEILLKKKNRKYHYYYLEKFENYPFGNKNLKEKCPKHCQNMSLPNKYISFQDFFYNNYYSYRI